MIYFIKVTINYVNEKIIRIIGNFVELKKIREIEISPIREIDNINAVIRFEIKSSSFLWTDLKLFDNMNKNKIVNIIKLIIEWFFSKKHYIQFNFYYLLEQWFVLL